MHELLVKMASVAHELDKSGYVREADEVTDVMVKLADWNNIWQNIKGIGSGLGTAARGIGSGVGAAAAGMNAAVKGIGSGVGAAAKGVGSGLYSAEKGLLGAIGGAAKDYLELPEHMPGTPQYKINQLQKQLQQQRQQQTNIIEQQKKMMQQQLTNPVQKAQILQSLAAQAAKASKDTQSGWAYLNNAVRNFSPEDQLQARKMFMAQIGQLRKYVA